MLEGAPEGELEDLGLLLQFLEEETAANRNFEFVQVGAALWVLPSSVQPGAASASPSRVAAWRRFTACQVQPGLWSLRRRLPALCTKPCPLARLLAPLPPAPRPALPALRRRCCA